MLPGSFVSPALSSQDLQQSPSTPDFSAMRSSNIYDDRSTTTCLSSPPSPCLSHKSLSSSDSCCATRGIAQLHIRRSSSSSMIFDPHPLSPGHGVNGKLNAHSHNNHHHHHHPHHHNHSLNTSISISQPGTTIHSLPVELLSRIFEFGSNDPLDSSTTFLVRADGSYHAPLSSLFQVSVSHVSRRWRDVALSTASLWSTLHFQHPSHLDRARTFLERVTRNNRSQLIDVAMDMSVPDGSSRTPSEIHLEHFHVIFEIVLPYLVRWRSYTLKVIDNECKLAARRCLSTCGPAPKLQVLQLYHFEDWDSPEHLFDTTNRPTVVVFQGSMPNLRDMSLIGVSLPWTQSIYFLKSFRTLELALHAETIRPSWEHWAQMLRASPGLEKLSLHYSGPQAPLPPVKMRKVIRFFSPSSSSSNGGDERFGGGVAGVEADHVRGEYGERGVMTDDGSSSAPEIGEEEDPTEKIQLPLLSELSLTELKPGYLVLLFRHLCMPAVTSLSLDLTLGDVSAFTDYLAGRLVVDPANPAVGAGLGPHHQDQHIQQQQQQYGHQPNGTRQRRSSAHGNSPTSPGVSAAGSMSPSSPSLSSSVSLSSRVIFPQLKHLRLIGLRCQARSLYHLLRTHTQLEVLEIDFCVVPAGWDVLTGTYARRNGLLVSSASSAAAAAVTPTTITAPPVLAPLQSELFLPNLRAVQVIGLPAEEHHRRMSVSLSSTAGSSIADENDNNSHSSNHRRAAVTTTATTATSSSPHSPRSPLSSYHAHHYASFHEEQPIAVPSTVEGALVGCLARLMRALPLVERWSVLVGSSIDSSEVERLVGSHGLLEFDDDEDDEDEEDVEGGDDGMVGGEGRRGKRRRRRRRRMVKIERQVEEEGEEEGDNDDDDDDTTGSSDEEGEVMEGEGEDLDEDGFDFSGDDHEGGGGVGTSVL